MTAEDMAKWRKWLDWQIKDELRVLGYDAPTASLTLHRGRLEAFLQVRAMLPRFDKLAAPRSKAEMTRLSRARAPRSARGEK